MESLMGLIGLGIAYITGHEDEISGMKLKLVKGEGCCAFSVRLEIWTL